MPGCCCIDGFVVNVFITLFFGSAVDFSSERGTALLKAGLEAFFLSSGLIMVSFPICRSGDAVMSLRFTKLSIALSTPDKVPGSRLSLVWEGGRE